MKFCGMMFQSRGCFVITKSVIFDGETGAFQAGLREEGSISLFHNSAKNFRLNL